MSGDYSRHRFNPRNHYSGVKMQQGRVQLDADWNEWSDAIDRRTRAEAVDTLGVSPSADIQGVAVVSPQTPDAFHIEADDGDLSIGPGRLYVDGLLAENFGDPDGSQVFDPVLAELWGSEAIAYDKQPYHPTPAPLPDGGPHLAYLEVWQREVTHLQRPDLVEKAIGVDTTTRTQTVWQVRLLHDVDASIGCSSPDADLPEAWAGLIAPSASRLSSRGKQVEGDTDPCELPPGGGYRGLENQLYRIEIHQGGGVGTARFKWSRDNASVAASVVEVVSSSELKLASLGRDAVLRFNSGDWVEIIDDRRELSGKDGDPKRRAGEMRKITVHEASQTISFSPALPADLLPAGDDAAEKYHLRVIRWDQTGKVPADDGSVLVDLDAAASDGLIPVPAADVWVNLEDGVQVQFSRDPGSGEFRCNDYWTVAARSADASVETLTQTPPQGIHRHYARLALVTFPDGEDDCRVHWPPACEGGCCSVTVRPGDDIQAAIDSLPAEGGCVCLKSGVHEIRAPLKILASNIRLQGEAAGATVRAMTELPYLLEVGNADQTVVDVEILEIRFEATQPVEASGLALLYLHDCAGLRVAHCELGMAAQEPTAYIGIFMQDVRDVTVSDNRLSDLQYGIWVGEHRDRLLIEGNHIEGNNLLMAHGRISLGEYGIRIESDAVAPCRIEGNRIEHFWTGVRLGEGTRGSSVIDNRFLRLGQLTDDTLPTTLDELLAYLDGRIYAIDIEDGHCRVEGNHIDLTSSQWGGIRSRGEHTLIAGNTLRATSKASPFNPVPGSIYCYALADQGKAADHAQISHNKLLGPQSGVVLSRIDGATVNGNIIEGQWAGWFGVRTADCHACHVRGNRIQEVFFATYHSSGEGNVVGDNQIGACGAGITAAFDDKLTVDGNAITGCPLYGTLLGVVSSARVIENRIDHCGFSSLLSAGLAVVSVDILVESDAMVYVKGNEVLDTGIDPQTNTGTDKAVTSMAVAGPSCNVSHNHTDYGQDVMEAELEHRALSLIGPLAWSIKLGSGTRELMFGSAVLTDNRFRGPGGSTLVEFLFMQIPADLPPGVDVDFRFEKVTFSNNVCEHLSAQPQEGEATVHLWGGDLIVMGNHVKADEGVNSMSLGHRQHVALMGNITSGNYIRVGTTTPTPLTDFNIRT